jgi:diguanylate cyclase (GGDEF)-like protein/PAS domain S-box-containing protein
MPRTILLVQDDAAPAAAIKAALGAPNDGAFKVEWVRSCGAALDLLAREAGHAERKWPDDVAALLVDLVLPDSRGIETFDRLFAAAPRIPILILTSFQDEPVAKLAVQRGAQDYLMLGHLDEFLLPKAVTSMIERSANAEALYDEKERARVTLNSIGDAVMSTSAAGNVTFLNVVAERLTGWSQSDALGRPLEEVFRIIDGTTREVAENPMTKAIREDQVVALTPNCVLIRRDGVEAAIEDSVAPIHDRRGQVTGAVMVFRDVSAARAMTLKMSYLAQHDSLTDLPNRVLLNDRLAEAIALSQRHDRKLAVLFLDLDRFKHINDSLGHAVGDQLLKSVSRRLFTCVRSSDTVSRQGGDEFVILLWEVRNAADAAAIADKILLALRAPHHIGQHELHITGSIGIVTFPEDGADEQTLLKHADVAMYHAKEGGRDNYQYFKPDMNARATERQSLEGDLRHAIERQELLLHYQPKVDLQTGRVAGVEALVRWQHPRLGLIPPDQFIGIAEDCGFIVPMGRWVLRQACQQARAWQDAGRHPVGIAVNVSTVELRAVDFVAGVRTILEETGLDPGQLELELTETFLLQDEPTVSEVLRQLKEIGVMLALDDFGTGYSSLSYLKRFPIDTVKIDRSFVRDIATDAGDASIVGAVIGMGANMQMRVVAEGVETREQLEFLKERSCPQGQGYFFSRPMAAQECGSLLGRDAAGAPTAGP